MIDLSLSSSELFSWFQADVTVSRQCPSSSLISFISVLRLHAMNTFLQFRQAHLLIIGLRSHFVGKSQVTCDEVRGSRVTSAAANGVRSYVLSTVTGKHK
jgi:hypothetical protein